MDWGLAKVLAEGGEAKPGPADPEATLGQTEIRTARDSGPPFTQYGSVLGTPAFMAPEQAAGELEKFGPRTDVFGLGAILCVLLTGLPPFDGKDAESVRINAVRGKTENAFARLDASGADPDVVALCKRCLAFEPADRPATADEVASAVAGLRQAADDRARQAERDRLSAEVRAAEQAKRRRAVQWAAVAVVGVLLVGVTGTLFGLVRADAARRDAEAAESAAEARRGEAEAERQAAVNARALAEARKKEADGANEQAQSNAREATKQSQLALRSFGTLIDQVQQQIGDSPGTQDLKLKLLETALAGLDQVAKSDEDSRLLGQSMAAAYMKLGQLFQQLGQSEKAFRQFEKCHEIVRALAEKDPDGDTAQSNLAATFTVLGEMSLELRRDAKATVEYYQKALEIRRKLDRRRLNSQLNPTKLRQDFAEALTRVGVTFLRLGESQKARPYFQEALDLRQELAAQMPKDPAAQLDLVRSLRALGGVESSTRNWPVARSHYEQALALSDRVRQDFPENPKYRWELANALGDVGGFEMRCGSLTAAQDYYDRNLRLMQELINLDPKNAQYSRYLALANYRVATLARQLGDAQTAERCNRVCLEIREKLAADDARNERRQLDLILALPRCGQHARAAELAAKIQGGAHVDREALVEVAQCYAQCARAVPPDSILRRQYTENALRALDQAVSNGYKDAVSLETNPDLDALREHPDFRSLVTRLKER